MSSDKVGRIVWHDLFTRDVHASKLFYQGVAEWHFVTEHATEFTWGGGAGDFILALSGDEAGAGFVECPDGQYSGWIPYVEVADVDAAAADAQILHGVVERAPFEVPGVGRNCHLRDPAGALIGICLSRHSFPTPTKQFGAERYVARPEVFPANFYRELFDWSVQSSDDPSADDRLIMRSGEQVAVEATNENRFSTCPLWVPGIRLTQLSEALRKVRDLEGSIMNPGRSDPHEESGVLVSDTNGTLSYFIPCR